MIKRTTVAKFSAIALSTALLIPTATVAQAASTGKALTDKSLFTVGMYDSLGRPVSKDITLKQADGYYIQFDVKFPDSAQPGDYIQLETGPGIGVGGSGFSEAILRDKEGRAIAQAKAGAGFGSDNTLKSYITFTLLESADGLINRGATLKAKNSVAERCLAKESVREKPMTVIFNGEEVPLITKTTISADKCSSSESTNPAPEGTIPIPKLECADTTFLNPKRAEYVPVLQKPHIANNKALENMVNIFASVDFKLVPGGTDDPIFSQLTAVFDGSNSPDRYTFADKPLTPEDMRKRVSYISRIPVIYDSENPRLAIPKNYLFPTPETAQEFKNMVIENYGEDMYYNTNNAYVDEWNKNTNTQLTIHNRGLKILQRWIAERTKVTDFDKSVPTYKAVISDVDGLTNPMTSEGVRISKDTQLHGIFDSYYIGISGNDAFAPYTGSASYGVKTSLTSDRNGYSAQCSYRNPSKESIKLIDGAGYGEKLPDSGEYEPDTPPTTEPPVTTTPPTTTEPPTTEPPTTEPPTTEPPTTTAPPTTEPPTTTAPPTTEPPTTEPPTTEPPTTEPPTTEPPTTEPPTTEPPTTEPPTTEPPTTEPPTTEPPTTEPPTTEPPTTEPPTTEPPTTEPPTTEPPTTEPPTTEPPTTTEPPSTTEPPVTTTTQPARVDDPNTKYDKKHGPSVNTGGKAEKVSLFVFLKEKIQSILS